MNYLAHGFLSGDSDSVLVGNFIGDFVKGRQLENYSPEIAKGILLHRKIDEYTDSHPVVTRSRNRIRKNYRHYTGVVIDIFYDHLLAINWGDYHNIPLENFCKHVYDVIIKHFGILPGRAKEMIPWMVKHDWLFNYSTLEGIDRSLKGLSRRTTFTSGMENAIIDLKYHYKNFTDDFREFFPDLIHYTKDVG
jgi:acyl carrier protein phosphodiesterase